MGRTWKDFSITSGGTPQPLVGTTISANIIASPAFQSVQVADTSMFDGLSGSEAFIDTFSNAEKILLKVVDGTHISAIFTKNHTSGAAISLSMYFTGLYVQTKAGNTGSIFIFNNTSQFVPQPSAGVQSLTMNKTNHVLCRAELQPVTVPTQPVEISSANNYGANPDNIAYWWVDGTTGDVYLPSIDIT